MIYTAKLDYSLHKLEIKKKKKGVDGFVIQGYYRLRNTDYYGGRQFKKSTGRAFVTVPVFFF